MKRYVHADPSSNAPCTRMIVGLAGGAAPCAAGAAVSAAVATRPRKHVTCSSEIWTAPPLISRRFWETRLPAPMRIRRPRRAERSPFA